MQYVIIPVDLPGFRATIPLTDLREAMEKPTTDRSLEDYLKYSRLVRSERRVAARLSPEDRKVLQELAVRDAADGELITRAYSEARLRLCAKRTSMTPAEIAEEWSRMVLEWRLGHVTRYLKGLEALSEAGRNAVEEYLATEIAPKLDVPAEADAIESAIEDPEGFMEAVELECYFAEHGEYPPEVQQQFDEFERKLRRGWPGTD